MCDCFIGILYQETQLHLSDYKSILIYEHKKHLSSIQYKNKVYGTNFHPWILNPKNYVDFRKPYIKKYTHCPECGEKINWIKLKKELKTEV